MSGILDMPPASSSTLILGGVWTCQRQRQAVVVEMSEREDVKRPLALGGKPYVHIKCNVGLILSHDVAMSVGTKTLLSFIY